MKLEQELFRFRRSEPSEVIDRVTRLIEAGAGWLNIQPMVDEEGLYEGSQFGLLKMFSSRGPRIPQGTFVPGPKGKRNPASVGLEHPQGPKAIERLEELGIPRPEGWRKRQDHAKRGIVFDAPPGTSPEAIVTWMLAAGTALAGVPVGDWWIVNVHLPAR